jgi:hypothetical protein
VVSGQSNLFKSWGRARLGCGLDEIPSLCNWFLVPGILNTIP